MSNHLHLIESAKKHDLSDTLRDFKKYTSKQIVSAIESSQHESRKAWILKYSEEKEPTITGTKNTSSGGRITNHRSYTTLTLSFRVGQKF